MAFIFSTGKIGVSKLRMDCMVILKILPVLKFVFAQQATVRNRILVGLASDFIHLPQRHRNYL
tara:strand:- start:300 stop:488 length:189 start_codon:yes stop_codon:yes gene_type:complete